MVQKVHKHDFTARADHIDMGEGFWLDETEISHAFWQVLPDRAADLLEVAMAAYAADRLSLRDFKGVATGQRRLHVRVAVREPDLWSSEGITSGLHEFLNWVSGDDWCFEFTQHPAEIAAIELEPHLFALPYKQPLNVALFSGGLDSLAGLAYHALQQPFATCILVSGYTNHRLLHQQQSQVKRIMDVLAKRPIHERLELCHVAIPFGISRNVHEKRVREEKSQRTRAFVFLALGAITAMLAKSHTLKVYENGIGALNLPLNETQLGVDNYRGVHPRSLVLASELFEKTLEHEIKIQNPFLFKTKAQMCEALMPTGIVDAISDTVSCDSFPVRHSGQPQCGFCPSCNLRRMSIEAVGLRRYDAVDGYRHDVLDGEPTLKNYQLYELSTTDYQVGRFKSCLDSDDPWKSLTIAFPKLALTWAQLVADEGLDDGQTVNDFHELFRRYVHEWDSFPANIQIASETN